MKKIQVIAVSFMISLIAVLGIPQMMPIAYAYSPVPDKAICDKAPDNPACVTNATDPVTGTKGVITRVSNVIAFAAAVIAVILIIFSGFRLVKSGGDSSKVAQARETIIYAIVGLIVIALSRAIVGLVISNI